MKGIDKVLRGKPWLKISNTNNITTRLQIKTKGNAFIVYNLLQQTYELHTLEAYNLSGDSYNCSLDRELLSQFLIWDYEANNFSNNLDTILSKKQEYELERNRKEKMLSETLNEHTEIALERVLGTRV